MRYYELVIVCDARVSEDDRKSTIQEIEWYLWNTIQQKDDVWFLDSSYDLHWKKWDDKMYLVSYYLYSEPSNIKKIKYKMKYTKGINRFFFFHMKNNQKFMTYQETQEKIQHIIENE